MYGNEIKETRKSFNYTQTQLSKETGIPQNTISWIESNEGIPNVYQCLKIAQVFGITIEELIGQDQNQLKKIYN